MRLLEFDSNQRGRVELEDEADEFRVPMPEFERLSECIEWIDLSLWSASGLPSGRFGWASGIILLICQREMPVSFSKVNSLNHVEPQTAESWL